MCVSSPTSSFFFFNDTATTEIYTLSLHDALPICNLRAQGSEIRAHFARLPGSEQGVPPTRALSELDRKSTRLNSSHQIISYAVFCLKKKRCWTASTAPKKPFHTR